MATDNSEEEERQKNREKYSDKLWELANVVTGFAIAQSIATTFAVASGQLEKGLSPHPLAGHSIGMILTVAFAWSYGEVIIWCHRTGAPRDCPEGAAIWRTTSAGRLLGIAVFNLITFATFAGSLLNLEAS